MLSTQSGPAGVGPTRPWPVDQVERWPIERLIPYANNPRLHNEADLGKIAASILKWGWTMPVLVDEQGELISGRARLRAAIILELNAAVGMGWSLDASEMRVSSTTARSASGFLILTAAIIVSAGMATT